MRKRKIKSEELIGKKFGLLTVLSEPPTVPHHPRMLLCACACGNPYALVRLHNVNNGTATSCGCFKRQNGARNLTTHGQTRFGKASPEYQSWRSMIQRCTNPKRRNYRWYGARGISVCSRWINSFEFFLKDMGRRPNGRTLDRFPNNDGNYEPGNCRWATPKQQARGLRRGHPKMRVK